MHVNDFILIMLIQYMILWALIIHMKVKTRNSDGSSVRGGPWKSNRKYRIKTEPDWEKLIKLYSLKLHQILKTRYPRTESCGPFIPYTKLIKCLSHPLMILQIFVMVHMRPMIYCAVRWICLQRLISTCRNLMQSNFCDDLQPYLIELSVLGK